MKNPNRSVFFNYLSLFASTGTLICCALPALLVSLGLGAVMAGLAGNVPGLIWVSENKNVVFAFAGLMLVVNGVWMWKNRNAPCPLDPAQRDACVKGRRYSLILYVVSLVLYIVGAFFAFIAPALL